MQSKLQIDLSQGIVNIEGDADLVREIYRDLKDQLLSGAPAPRTGATPSGDKDSDDAGADVKPKSKRRVSSRKKTEGESNGSGVNADAPKLDRDLDTSGLLAFFGQYEHKNHSEKILTFLHFLTDKLDIEAPNTDQVFTCYVKANERVPKAFKQAFRDTSGKSFGYIDFKSPTDIRVTTAGTNHFKFDLKKKAAE